MDYQNDILVAIADDHTLIRDAISNMIETFSDFKIYISSSNGSDLIEKIKSGKRLPDICVLDISMPVMNGYEAAIEIKKNWPDINILALTMFDDEYCIIKMINAGVSGYVLKSGDSKELETALRTVHSQGIYYPQVYQNQLLHGIMKKRFDPPALTPKELELLAYCVTDLTYKQIASEMKTSMRSIDGHRDSLFQKLNVKNRVGLAVFAIKTGLVHLH
jgi:DNA-binding NarL/FixJ family response regulator